MPLSPNIFPQEYFVANRSMRVTPVAIGLMVSYLSAVSLLGVSSENYVYGTQYAVINISYGLATPFAAYFYLPVFYKLHATSAFEVKRSVGHCCAFAPVLIDKNRFYLINRYSTFYSICRDASAQSPD